MAAKQMETVRLGTPTHMEELRHYWHPVLRSTEVAGNLVAARLLDQPLVLWRSSGRIAAFYDLCIHRGTPLSLGWIKDDQLVCGYHGWHYGADGACTRLPSLPSDRAIPAKARATTYRVEERYGLVWVCLDEPRADIPFFPPEFGDPTWGWDVYSSEGVWKANVARMVENLADFSHFPWAHPGLLGNPEQPECQTVTIEPIEGGFQYEIEPPVAKLAAATPPRQRYRVLLPFMLTIDRYQPGSTERMTNIYVFTPISSKETRFFRFSGRNYRDPKPDEELNRMHRTVFEQDRVLVEAQRPEELPLDLSEELHLRGPDTPAVEFRRRLRELGISWA